MTKLFTIWMIGTLSVNIAFWIGWLVRFTEDKAWILIPIMLGGIFCIFFGFLIAEIFTN